MRKSLILTLAMLVLTAAGMIFVSAGVSRTGDDVVWEETVLSGDVSAAEGLEVFTDIRCTQHMYWGTAYQVGHPENISTDFEFYPESRKRTWEPTYSGISLEYAAGFGSSIGGGTFDMATEYLFGYNKVFADVASRTLPGEEHTERVMLDDYYEYYPMEIRVDLPEVYIYAGYDDGDPDIITGQEEMARALREFVKIPVSEDTVADVTVEKNGDGGVVSVYLNYIDSGVYVSAFSEYTENKCFFVLDCVNADDETPADMSHMAAGFGIYCLEYDSEKGTADTENIKNVFPLDQVDIEHFAMSEDKSRLLMITDENGAYYLTVIDAVTFAQLQRIEISDSGEEKWLHTVYEGEDFLTVAISIDDGRELVLLARGEDGGYEKKFAHVMTEEVEEKTYFTLRYARMAWDGERLAISGYADGTYSECGIYVFVYTADGLEYLARYDSSLEKGYVDKSSYRCTPESYSLGPIPTWK